MVPEERPAVYWLEARSSSSSVAPELWPELDQCRIHEELREEVNALKAMVNALREESEKVRNERAALEELAAARKKKKDNEYAGAVDNGKGGIFALYSLLCRDSQKGLLNSSGAAEDNLSAYILKIL
ncbi:hypothetical protein IFM89_004757 [Coptis chinensis]|uniref:Uncharacterized protein n=1 Tax=Coptis chinensis TaxID=261450 RepID=A0A835LUN6_9MAGN|nr:hypothetical protein IFM89_004757 [Coptis chinensis]